MRFELNKKTVGGFFLILLVLLIFFSRTMYSFNLTRVTAVKPSNGRLSKLEITNGLASWAEIERVYAQVSGTAGEILVREGEQVEAGQPLFNLEFDRDEAERKLREINASRERYKLDIQNILLREEKLSGANGTVAYELDQTERDIQKARDTLDDAKALFEIGEFSRRDLESAEAALENLYLKKEKAQADYQADLQSLQLELKSKEMDLSNLLLQEEPYLKALADYENYSVITAPASGQLLSLNVQKGVSINEKALLAEIGVGHDFIVECNISLENNFVLPGDSCELSNSTHTFNGTVQRLNPGERGKTVEVYLVSENVTAGETFDIVFEKISDTTYTLVPNSALNQDNDGYFLYQVKRRNGMLGKEYYLERLNVYIGDSDSKNTAIVKGVTFFDPVVLTSEKAVSAGEIISLTNVGDFFAD